MKSPNVSEEKHGKRNVLDSFFFIWDRYKEVTRSFCGHLSTCRSFVFLTGLSLVVSFTTTFNFNVKFEKSLCAEYWSL